MLFHHIKTETHRLRLTATATSQQKHNPVTCFCSLETPLTKVQAWVCDDSLHDIFHTVAVAKLMYASNAWWGFSNANDRQKIFASIRRCIRTGFYSPDLADFHDLYISSDKKLFKKILTISYGHSCTYCTEWRTDLTIDSYLAALMTDCNFTVRMLYRNMYWLLYILALCYVLFLCTTAVWQFIINVCYVVRPQWTAEDKHWQTITDSA